MTVAERIEVADAPDRDRYELSIDGDVVGFAAYRPRPGLIGVQPDPRPLTQDPSRRVLLACAVVVRSANAIQLGKLVLGEGERSAFDVVAQVRDG